MLVKEITLTLAILDQVNISFVEGIYKKSQERIFFFKKGDGQVHFYNQNKPNQTGIFFSLGIG